MKKTTLFQAFVVTALFIAPLFVKSCANTSTPPAGGPKDSIPPILVAIEPAYNTVNHPRDVKHSSISFQFDEYVALDAPNTNIYLSPPQSKPPKAKIKGKKVVVTFEEPLDSNKSYSLSLGASVKDNNEGNAFPPYVHSFSTGDHIDSLFVSGTIVDAVTMLPMGGITVLFHTDPSDSAIYKVLPKAAAKSDIWGYYAVRNLPADTSYRVFAIEDLNNNNLYDPDQERVAFIDTIVTPRSVMHFDSPELVARDLKDTAACLSRPSETSLSLFRELTTKHILMNRERTSRRSIYVTFSAPDPQIDSIRLDGIPTEKLIFEYNRSRDSIMIWINEQGGVHDTLTMRVNYMKSDDSLKILVPAADTFRMAIPKPKKEKNRRGEMVEVVDTVAKYKVEITPEVIDQEGIIFLFETPLIESPFDSIKIKSVNTRQQEAPMTFKIERDTIDIKKYILRLDEKLTTGFEYTIKMPAKSFRDINGNYCDSLEKKFSLPSDDKLSSLTLEVTDFPERMNYLIELVDEKRTKIYRKYAIDTTATLNFPYLKSGKYSLRITQDKNGNGVIDTGSILLRKQPEKVIMYRFNASLGNDAYITEIPERTDLVQNINIGELFK